MNGPLDTKVTFEELAEQFKRLEGQVITNGAGLALHILTSIHMERRQAGRIDEPPAGAS